MLRCRHFPLVIFRRPCAGIDLIFAVPGVRDVHRHRLFPSRFLDSPCLSPLHAVLAATAEPRVMPQPAPCRTTARCATAISSDAWTSTTSGVHAYAHLMVLPGTDKRDAAALFVWRDVGPVWAAGGWCLDGLWLGGRGALIQQHGPLRLNLTALLWPLLPLVKHRRCPQTMMA